MTRDKLLAYVAMLDEDMQSLFRQADRYRLENNDTLAEEWQIAAAIVAIFKQRARDWECP